MHFRRVYLESFGYTLPDEIVTTAELEQRLAPLYERLRLARRPAGADDGHPRAAILPARHAAQHDQHRIGPPGDRSQRHRPAEFRRTHSRLGLPRFSGAGHRLPRASRPRPAERGDDLRRLERLPRPAQRHRADRQHDRARADSRRRGRRHRVRPRAGREHDRAAQRRHDAHARVGQKLDRLAHDRLGERGDRALRRRAEPNRQPADDRGRLLRHQPARSLPKPRPRSDHADRQRGS